MIERMLITSGTALKYRRKKHADLIKGVFPNGFEPTAENLHRLYDADAALNWLTYLLPTEGVSSKRAYILWCAEEIAPLIRVQEFRDVIATAKQKLEDPLISLKEQYSAVHEAVYYCHKVYESCPKTYQTVIFNAVSAVITGLCCDDLRDKVQWVEFYSALARSTFYDHDHEVEDITFENALKKQLACLSALLLQSPTLPAHEAWTVEVKEPTKVSHILHEINHDQMWLRFLFKVELITGPMRGAI